MAGQRGRDVLISIGDGDEPESFIGVAGIRARTISLTAGLIEATTAQSAQAWREVISGAGVKRAEVAGSGVFKDAISDALMRTAFFAGDASTFELGIPGFGVLTGPFVIVELTYGGEHDGEATFSVRLASAGLVDEAAKAAGDALERALLKATQTVERELARIVKTGEDDLDRLARKIAETLAQLALDGVLGGIGGGGVGGDGPRDEGASSFNQVAAALAKAARRGMRFT